MSIPMEIMKGLDSALKEHVKEIEHLKKENCRLKEQLEDEEDKPDLSMALEAACENCDKLRAENEDLNRTVDKLDEEIRAYVIRVNDLKAENERLLDLRIEDLSEETQTRLAALEAEIAILTADRDVYSGVVDELKDKIADLTDNYESLGKLCDELEAENDVLKDEQASSESDEEETCNGEVIKLEAENATLKADYKSLDECYTIMQRINAEIDPRDVVAENDELKAENERLKDETCGITCLEHDNVLKANVKLANEITTLKAENATLKEEAKDYVKMAKFINDDVPVMERTIATLKAENERLRDYIGLPIITELKADLAQANKRIEREKKEHAEAMADLMKTCNKRIERYEEAITKARDWSKDVIDILSALDSDNEDFSRVDGSY